MAHFNPSKFPVKNTRNDKTKQLNSGDNKVGTAVPQMTVVDRGMPRPWRIGLLIMQMQVELIFDLTETVLIGRSYPETEPFHGVDLSPFNAYEMGISRQHALLRLEKEHVVLIDKNSANGTLLNDERLAADEPYPVRNGDRVQFGVMEVKIELLMNPFELN